MPAKQYIHYSIPKGMEASPEFKAGPVEDVINQAFSSGLIKPGKSSDDLDDLEKSKIVLDSSSGNLRLRFDGRTSWFRPHLKCPDCSRQLKFKKNFITKNRRNASKWIYICEGFDDGDCKSFFPANTTGKLTYELADAKTREARSLTNKMFLRLWQETPDILDWAGDESEMRVVMNKAKGRAFRYLATKMKEEGHEEGNIPKMDIPTLRVAYKICKNADLNEVMKSEKIL